MCGILKKITHAVSSVAKSPIGQILAPIAAGFALGPAGFGLTSAATGAALGGAADSLIAGKGLKNAAISGLGSYAGNAIGSQLLPQTIGSTIGDTASNAIGGAEAGLGSALGTGFSQTASNALLNTTVGGALGSYAGGQIASNFTEKPQSQDQNQTTPDPNSLLPAAFSPKQSPSLQLPGSLSGLEGMDQNQQTSNLATQGVYGGGLGPQEQDYFKGLVNNQLVDPSGKTADINSLSPIENSYLSQLGFGGYSNSKDLLGALSKWKQQAA